MSFYSLAVLALGVSADAFAVALGKGLQVKRYIPLVALILAAAFGLAQAMMPLLGWFLGTSFARLISPVDHWIAFGLLAGIGLKLIWEAVHPDQDTEGEFRLRIKEIIILAVATSIDALAVGVSLAVLDVSILLAITTIGVITFASAYAAVFIGHHVGSRFRTPAEIMGGLILIGIGASVLVEHLSTGV